MEEPQGIGVEEPCKGRRPKTFVAFCLSLLCLGAGQMYCGFPGRALAVVLLTMASTLALGFGLMYTPPWPLLYNLALLFPILARGLLAYDAYRCALRPAAREISSWYLGAFVLTFYLLPQLEVTREVFNAVSPVHSYYIPSGNMVPTLNPKDYILVRTLPFEARRGDVVVFEPPDTYHGNKSELLSRIVAVGGDEVEIKQGALYINGQKQEEPYVAAPSREPFEAYRVPQGQFFMLGDDRNNSFDSRYWLSVPARNLKGRVMRILSSKEPGRTGQPL